MNARSLANGTAVAVATLGGLALAGWAFDFEALESVLPGLGSMKANAALAFVFAGLSLWLQAREDASGRRRRVARAAALAVALIGSLTLLEYAARLDLGIDQLLFDDATTALEAWSPGRMAPVTAFAFLTLGLALLLLDTRIRGSRPAQALALAGAAVAFTSLLGYLLRVPPVYGIGSYVQMALHTTLGLLALSAGVLLARPGQGLVALLTSKGPGGEAARRLLPAAVVIPIVLAWLRLEGQRLDLYGTEFGVSLLALCSVGILGTLVWWSALRLERLDTERRRAHATVASAEARFRGLVEAAPDAIVGTDAQGRILLVNRRTEETFGYSRDELLGQPEEILLPQRLRQAGPDPVGRRKDGAEFPVEIRSSPLDSPDGMVAMALVRDVTERRLAEETLARYAAELQRSNADLQEFALVASHDLQEPLRKITAFGERLRQRAAGALDETALDYLARMERAAERMGGLIESLLELSRVTSQGTPFVATDLGAAVADVLADLDVRVRAAGARVEVGPLPVVAADAAQMRRLFQNLIANALKFREPGKSPSISVRSERLTGGAWRCTVEDDGIGFDEKYLDRVFKPFQRLHGRGEFEGSGMGLAICRKIAARHGGEITARSRPGAGSAFSVTLPEGPLAKGA